jgi:magnesium chelatase subunit D
VLVVVTDGRGNVPLAVSHGSQLVYPVKNKGIEDAIEAARRIQGLSKVESFVLNPTPKHYSDLPVNLARALGAKVVMIPRFDPWEVNQ